MHVSLHFMLGIAKAKYIYWSRQCVCLYVCQAVCPSPRSHTIARTRM